MSHDVNQLKELLFDEEQQELSVLQARLERVASEERLARDELQTQIKAIIERASARDQRINTLYELTGSTDRLRSSVAEILDGALKDVDADRTKSADLRRAMTPFVASTVTAEIRNNKDALVQVLSPSLGLMIRDYITSAMNDMMAQINRKLENAMPGSKRRMRAKAKAAGMTMAEMVLAETQKLEVVELYLVRRGSGKIISRWSREALELETDIALDDASTDNRARLGDNRDALVGGFLSAITEFAKEAFEADKASLRALQIDGFQIFLRHSPAYLLAAKCSGAPLPGIDKAIDAEFLSIMDKYDDLLSQAGSNRPAPSGLNGAADAASANAATGAVHSGRLSGGLSGAAANANAGREGAAAPPTAALALSQALPELASSLEARMSLRHDELFKTDDTPRRNPLKTMLWVIGLPLLALLGWLGWQNYWTSWTADKTRQTISQLSPMRGYPIDVQVDYGGGGVQISGLTPSRRVKDELVANLKIAMPLVTVSDELTVIPTPKTVDPGPQIMAVKKDLKRHSNDAGKKFVTLEKQSLKRVSTLDQRNKKRLSALETRNQRELKELIARAVSTREALGKLRAQQDQRLAELKRDITRAAMNRALDQAAKRVLLVRREVSGAQSRGGLDRKTSKQLGNTAQEATAALIKIARLKKSLANRTTNPRLLTSNLNTLTGKISASSKMLAAQAGLSLIGADGNARSSDPTQAAEELALAAERLLMTNTANMRAIQLAPLKENVGKVSRNIGAVSSEVTTLNSRVDKLAPEVTTLNQRIDKLLPGARDRLELWTRRNAVFFATAAIFRNPKVASAKLNQLSGLLKDTNLLLRIIGYTDAKGTQVSNAPLALARAKKVRNELIARGVPTQQLAVVGRIHGPDLGPETGDSSVNRRVEFELGFDGERAASR